MIIIIRKYQNINTNKNEECHYYFKNIIGSFLLNFHVENLKQLTKRDFRGSITIHSLSLH